jgi:putative peptide zinc metalloprotease protein
MNADELIPWRTRADLISDDSADEWAADPAADFTVKDPVRDEFYRFAPHEYFLLKFLHQPRTYAALLQAAANELGERFAISDVQNYLQQLAQDNLVVPLRMGDGQRLFRQRVRQQSNQWKQSVLGILSIKLPGHHPGGWLPALKPIGWLLFNPVSLSLFVVLVVATCLFGLFSISSVAAKVPSLANLLTPQHLVLVLVCFSIAKILHELGHAVACQYTGRECTELGVLLLVFVPCLYCDVSDMWTEKSRGRRILVSLAGVYVEMAIALVCFWMWFFTVPGPLNYLCYSLLLITSVNTLFINGNPLMRYDGYYALSDLAKIPNLSAAARDHVNGVIGKFFLRRDQWFGRKSNAGFLWAYGLAAAVYRWVILVVIAFSIWKFFDFQQLRAIGNTVVVLVACTLAIPLLIASKRTAEQIFTQGLRWGNTLLVALIIAGVGYLFLKVEFSHRIWGVAEIQLSDPEFVFSPLDGRFVAEVVDGQKVQKGDLLGTVLNLDLKSQQVQLESQLEEARLNLRLLDLQTGTAELAGKAEFWKKHQATLRRQHEENREMQQRMNVLAPRDGQVIAFHVAPEKKSERLSKTEGNLLAVENRSCQVNRGDPVCYIGAPERLRGLVSVDEKDVQLVKPGAVVKVAIPFSSDSASGRVQEISLENDQRFRQEAISAETTDQVTYQVEIELPADRRIRVDSRQQVVIICHQTTAGEFVGRWLRNSFWF